MKRILYIFLFIFSISVSAYSADFKVVARVNDDIITQYDLDNYTKLLEIYLKDNIKSAKEMQRDILNSLIEERLKAQAVKNENIEFDKEEFNYYASSATNDKETNRRLIRNGVDKNLYLDLLKNNFLWSKLIDTKIKPKININNSEIDDSLEYLVDGAVRTRYNISQIIIYKNQNSDPKNIVDKLYSEIKLKNNFESIADKFSQDSKKNKGYVGWVDENDINEELYNSIKGLSVGSITKPIYFGDLNSGYYLIVKLNDKKQEKVAKKEEISRVQYVIYGQKLNLEIKNYLDNLYNNSLIEIFLQ